MEIIADETACTQIQKIVLCGLRNRMTSIAKENPVSLRAELSFRFPIRLQPFDVVCAVKIGKRGEIKHMTAETAKSVCRYFERQVKAGHMTGGTGGAPVCGIPIERLWIKRMQSRQDGVLLIFFEHQKIIENGLNVFIEPKMNDKSILSTCGWSEQAKKNRSAVLYAHDRVKNMITLIKRYRTRSNRTKEPGAVRVNGAHADDLMKKVIILHEYAHNRDFTADALLAHAAEAARYFHYWHDNMKNGLTNACAQDEIEHSALFFENSMEKVEALLLKAPKKGEDYG